MAAKADNDAGTEREHPPTLTPVASDDALEQSQQSTEENQFSICFRLDLEGTSLVDERDDDTNDDDNEIAIANAKIFRGVALESNKVTFRDYRGRISETRNPRPKSSQSIKIDKAVDVLDEAHYSVPGNRKLQKILAYETQSDVKTMIEKALKRGQRRNGPETKEKKNNGNGANRIALCVIGRECNPSVSLDDI